MKRRTIQIEAVRELLRRGGRRLGPPGAWTQGRQAETSAGEDAQPESREAAQWDLLGALRVEAVGMCGGPFAGSARELYEAAAARLAEALVYQLDCRRVSRDAATAVAHWNDADERTQAEVIDLFAVAA